MVIASVVLLSSSSIDSTINSVSVVIFILVPVVLLVLLLLIVVYVEVSVVQVWYLQQHVSWFDASVRRHSTTLHDGADVDASISSVVALTNNADAQEVVAF